MPEPIALPVHLEDVDFYYLFRTGGRLGGCLLNDPESTKQSASDETRASRPWLFYGWIVVGLSFVTMGFHSTARISFSVFQVPLIEEFGWSRGALGGAYALMMVLYALVGPFAGSRFERLGPRAVIPWGSFLIGISLMGGFFITSLWHVYFLTGIFLAVGNSLSGFSMHSALIPRWFSKKRGLATGITLAGSGVGGLLLVPVIERLIGHFGWRAAYLFFGLALFLFLAPANFLLLRNRAQDVGQPLDGLPSGDSGEPAVSSCAEERAKRTPEVIRFIKGDRRFWVLALITFTIGICSNTIVSQLQLYFVDANYGMATSAIILGMLGFFRLGGSVVTGWVSDYLGRQGSLTLSAALSAAGIVLLLLIPRLGFAPFPGYAFAVIFGFGSGGMTTCFSAMAADTFKGPSLATIMGILQVAYGLGGALGPPLAGYTFDVTGSYTAPFSLIVLALFVMIFVSLFAYKRLPRGRVEQEGPV
ncbi:MFS transporter [Nitrospinota bacterium]